ncbi:SRPBCC family protein [Conyzicola sp.]|uniref:SRPBCC family protein n=1 Tax=Conyzicola sp. TaxID=1969404 RepID=UPI00398911F4
MARHADTTDIAADIDSVRRVLLDPSAVAHWNPAITRSATSETAARPGVAYAVTVKSFVRATLTYGHPGSDAVVEYELRAPGAREMGRWTLGALDAGHTRVEHTFEHGGPVLSLMSGAFDRVAEWRLARLKDFAESRASR